MENIIKYLTGEGRIVFRAPVSFLLALSLSVVGIWATFNFVYAERTASYEERLKLKDDRIEDYKIKLSGATPDEAQKRIQALELQIKALSPRRLSNDQKQAIVKPLSGVQGNISIAQDMAVADAKPISADLAVAFQSAGWGVMLPVILGPSNVPTSGIALRVRNVDALGRIEQSVKAALQAAGLDFDVQNGLRVPPSRSESASEFSSVPREPNPDVEILVTSKTN